MGPLTHRTSVGITAPLRVVEVEAARRSFKIVPIEVRILILLAEVLGLERPIKRAIRNKLEIPAAIVWTVNITTIKTLIITKVTNPPEKPKLFPAKGTMGEGTEKVIESGKSSLMK